MSRRVNNTFHKAGSCKHWLSKDKEETETESGIFFIFGSFGFYFYTVSEKDGIKLLMLSRSYIFKSIGGSKHQFHIRNYHYFIFSI